jgi:pimeloyl-ACP methyl ester carboxylesterase
MQWNPAAPIERAFTSSRPVLAYIVSGAANGVPVVLLHGVGSSASTWAELLPRLGSEYRYIAADYRGHGASEPVEGPYQVDDFIADHLRLLDELEITSAHLVGFSIGAIFAQAIAVAHPDRTRSLILLNSIAGRTEAERERALDRLEHIRTTPPADVASVSVQRWFTTEFLQRRPDLVEAEVAIIANVDHDSYTASYRVLATSDRLSDAHLVQTPTLIVTGELDVGSTPLMSQQLHARISGSQLMIRPGLRHYLHIEDAAALGALITDFLRTTEQSEGANR